MESENRFAFAKIFSGPHIGLQKRSIASWINRFRSGSRGGFQRNSQHMPRGGMLAARLFEAILARGLAITEDYRQANSCHAKKGCADAFQ